MAQLTIRTDEELVARVRAAAKATGVSMNTYVSRVLDAATNPDYASSHRERLYERLREAGLVEDTRKPDIAAPSSDSLAGAREAAGRGTQLSELVSGGR